MHLLWISEHADFVGGAERHIARCVDAMPDDQHTLLFETTGHHNHAFTKRFNEGVFPLVDPKEQIAALKPDWTFVHQLSARWSIADFKSAKHLLRYHHDHNLFCLRRHKITLINKETCTRPIGPHCYLCSAGVRRQHGGIQLRSLKKAQQQIDEHRSITMNIAGSSYMSEHLQLHGIPASQISVIPPAVATTDLTFAAPDRESDLFLFVGSLTYGKGLDILLDALTRIPRVRLVVIGQGPQSYFFQEQMARLRLVDRVIFVGEQSEDELKHWYMRANSVILCNRAPETFGMSGAEAQNYGARVIASDIGGAREWMDQKRGWLVPPNDPNALAYAMREATTRPLDGVLRTQWSADEHVDALRTLLASKLQSEPNECVR